MNNVEILVLAVVIFFTSIGTIYSEMVKRRIDKLSMRIARLEGEKRAIESVNHE